MNSPGERGTLTKKDEGRKSVLKKRIWNIILAAILILAVSGPVFSPGDTDVYAEEQLVVQGNYQIWEVFPKGSTPTLSVEVVSGDTNGLSYQWYVDEYPADTEEIISGATSADYRVKTLGKEAKYHCVVSNAAGQKADYYLRVAMELDLHPSISFDPPETAYNGNVRATCTLAGEDAGLIAGDSDTYYFWVAYDSKDHRTEYGKTTSNYIDISGLKEYSIIQVGVYTSYICTYWGGQDICIDDGFYARAEKEHVDGDLGSSVEIKVIAGTDENADLTYEWYHGYVTTAPSGGYQAITYEGNQGKRITGESGPSISVVLTDYEEYYYCRVVDTKYNNVKWVRISVGPGEKTERNTIKGKSVYNKTGKVSKSQSFTLDTVCKYGKLTFLSSSKYVKVNSAGKVTISANFTGNAVIYTYSPDSPTYINQYKLIKVNVKPGRMSVSKAVNIKKQAVKVTWKKMNGASKYQIRVAANSKMTKNKKTYNVSSKYNYCKTGKLKKGKTYYVQIRAYNKQLKAWGSWSSKKKAKIKK